MTSCYLTIHGKLTSVPFLQITIVFLPDTTGLDLEEIDRMSLALASNRMYDGPARDPKHLSYYERWSSFADIPQAQRQAAPQQAMQIIP